MDTNDPARRDVGCVKIDCIALSMIVKGTAVQVVFSFILLDREGIELGEKTVYAASIKICFNDQGTVFEI